MPSLDQFAVNVEDVVPLPGLIEAEHVGSGTDTVTVFESHDTVPPGPVATSVTLWLPAGRVLAYVPEQPTAP